MRVLMLNHNVAFSGGTFYRAFHFGRHLARLGHGVTLISIAKSNRFRSVRQIVDGMTIIESPDLMVGSARSGWDLYDTAARFRYVSEQDWDIVHAWDCRPAVILPALHAKRGNKSARLIIDWADWWGRGGTISERSGWLVRTFFGPVETWFEEAFRTRADWTTVISSALRERVVGLGVPRSRVMILPLGCDVEGVHPENGQDARRQLGIAPDIPLIGSVGALLANEGRLLWDTVRELFRLQPRALFVLAGRHRSFVPSDLQSTNRVIETGIVPDPILFKWLAACDVMVTALADSIASRGRWPGRVNFYLAAGKATVISRVGDIPKLLESENIGVVGPAEALELAKVTSDLLDDPERRFSLQLRSRTFAEEKLSWRVTTNQLVSIYQSALDGSQRT